MRLSFEWRTMTKMEMEMTTMKKTFTLLLAAMLVSVSLAGCSAAERNEDLIGTWDWVESIGGVESVMTPGAIVLRANGGYSWMGVDYEALGWRWSSRDGVVSFALAGTQTSWFSYEFVDSNTLRIEYTVTPGVSFTLRRAR